MQADRKQIDLVGEAGVTPRRPEVPRYASGSGRVGETGTAWSGDTCAHLQRDRQSQSQRQSRHYQWLPAMSVHSLCMSRSLAFCTSDTISLVLVAATRNLLRPPLTLLLFRLDLGAVVANSWSKYCTRSSFSRDTDGPQLSHFLRQPTLVLRQPYPIKPVNIGKMLLLHFFLAPQIQNWFL